MSLLLKALENAAKNREAGATGSDAAAPVQQAAAAEGASELSLQPMEETPADTASRSEPVAASASSRHAADRSARPTERNGMASRVQAQNVLRAGATRDGNAGGSSPGIMAWLARRPLMAFSTAAGLFAIGYGVYLYLQITNPGLFMARPAAPAPGPALTAPPSAPPPMNPATAPGPVAAAPGEPVSPPGAAGALPGPQEPRAAAAPTAPPSIVPPPVPPAAGPVAPPVTPAEPPRSAFAPPPAPPGPAGQPAASGAPAAPAAASAPPARPAPPIAVAATPAREPAPAARAGGTSRAPAARQAPAPSTPAPVTVSQSDLNGAYQALQKGETNEAERLYRQVLASDPRNVDAMLGLASVHGQQNRADAATQLYMRVLEVDPRNSYAQAGLLNIGGRADPAAAESRLKQLIAREPSAYLYFTLGNLYAEQNQWASAQGAYFQAFNLAPDNPDYAFNLAVGLEHLSQPKLALDYYRRAVSIAQTRGGAQFALAPVQARIRSLEAVLAERP